MAFNKKNTRQELVDSIIASMKTRNSDWQKTWNNSSSKTAPYNPINGNKYKGINFFVLSLEQTKLNTVDPRWCTFDQAVEAGFKIPKNTQAAHAHFYDLKVSLEKDGVHHEIKAKNMHSYIVEIIRYYQEQYPEKKEEIKKGLVTANKLQNAIKSEKGKFALFVGELNKATGANLKLNANTVMRSFPIFNYSQLDNVPKLEITPNYNKFEPIKRAEGILVASGAKIYHDSANSNYYVPSKHEIHLTSKDSFKSREAYYSTALHELAHWTRGDGLVRHVKHDEKTGNGHELAYAREELRAELASIFMASDLDLKLDIQNHAAYLGSYLQLFNNDYNEFFSAVSDAQKIATHVLGLEKRLDLDSTNAKELQTKNPELYQKISEFNTNSNNVDNTHTKANLIGEFKSGDVFIARTKDYELRRYQIDQIINDKLIVKDIAFDVVQEHSTQSFQNLLNAYHAEKLNVTNPQLEIHFEYYDIAEDVFKNEFSTVAKQSLEDNFIFNDAKTAQQFIDTLTLKHDVPNNMITSSNFERKDKVQSLIVSHNDDNIAVAAKESANKVYLKTFFEEKNIPTTEFDVYHNGHDMPIKSDVVIDYLVNHLNNDAQNQVKDTLVKIESTEADINDFLKHCAQAMVLQQEAAMAMHQDFINESHKSMDHNQENYVDTSKRDDYDFSR